MNGNFSLENAFQIAKLSELKSKPLKHYEKLEKSNSYLYQSFLLNSELNNEEEIENTFVINPNTNIILKEDLAKMLNRLNPEEKKTYSEKEFSVSLKEKIRNLRKLNKKGNILQTNFCLDYLAPEKAKKTESQIAAKKDTESNKISINQIQEDDFEEALKKKEEEKPKKKTTSSYASNKISEKSLKQNTSNISNNNKNKINNKKNEAKKVNFEKRPYLNMSLDALKKENENLKKKINEIEARNKDAKKKEEEIKKLKGLTNKWKRIAQDTCYSLIGMFPDTQDGKKTTLKSFLDFFKVDYGKVDYDEENDEFLNY